MDCADVREKSTYCSETLPLPPLVPFLVSAWKAALVREAEWSVMFPFSVRAWALPLVEIWNLPFTEQVLCVHFACFFVAGGGGDSGDG